MTQQAQTLKRMSRHIFPPQRSTRRHSVRGIGYGPMSIGRVLHEQLGIERRQGRNIQSLVLSRQLDLFQDGHDLNSGKSPVQEAMKAIADCVSQRPGELGISVRLSISHQKRSVLAAMMQRATARSRAAGPVANK